MRIPRKSFRALNLGTGARSSGSAGTLAGGFLEALQRAGRGAGAPWFMAPTSTSNIFGGASPFHEPAIGRSADALVRAMPTAGSKRADEGVRAPADGGFKESFRRYAFATMEVEATPEPRSSADIPVRGFGRLSSRQFGRRRPVASLAGWRRGLEHGTGKSREPADRNVRATGFMAWGRMAVLQEEFRDGRTTVPPHPGPLPLGGGEGEARRTAGKLFAVLSPIVGIHRQIWFTCDQDSLSA